MNCPVHRIRQLDENFYCADCQKYWRKQLVEDFWRGYDTFREEWKSEVREADLHFEAKLQTLLKAVADSEKQ